MKLVKFIYIKFFYSLFLSFFTSFFIFFIFSLLGNLGKKISFNEIIFVSLINALEVLSSIPSFIIFFSIALFLMVLKSNNEILIIKEYFSFNKILIIFLPFIFFFSLIEINKFTISKIFIDIKNDYLHLDENISNKVIITSNNEKKTFLVLKGIDLNESNINEFQKYKVNKNLILEGEYSKELNLINNELVAQNIYKYEYENNRMSKISKPKVIIKNYSKYDNKNSVYNFTNNQSKLDFFVFIKFLNLIIFFCCLYLISFNKKYINIKNNSLTPLTICFGLLIYNQVINSIEITQQDYLFNIFIILFFTLIFIRYSKYE